MGKTSPAKTEKNYEVDTIRQTEVCINLIIYSLVDSEGESTTEIKQLLSGRSGI